MLDLLRLRLRAAARAAAAVGRAEPAWAAALLALLGIAAAFAWTLPRSPVGAIRLATAGLAVPVLVHGFRRDARLLTLSGHRPRRVFALDYVGLTMPVAAVLLAQGRTAAAAALLVAAAALPLLPAGRAGAFARRGRRRRALGPHWAFEWVAGLRAAWFPLALVYGLGVLFSAIPALWSLMLVLATLVACGFYTEAEGHQLVVVEEMGPARFLRAKVGRALAAWAVMVSPLVLVYAVRGSGAWLVPGAAIVASAVILAGSVVAKYAAYREGRRMGALGTLVPLLLAASVVFLPAALVLLPRLWRAARINLEPYLNAFD